MTPAKKLDAPEKTCPRLLTVEQAGEVLALGPWRVRALIPRGELQLCSFARAHMYGTAKLGFRAR